MTTLNLLMGLGTHLTDGILVEPLASTGYARAALAVDAVQSGAGSNNAQAAWGPCTSDWGSLGYAALFDPQGNQILAWQLGTPVVVTVAGDSSALLPAATLTVTFGPAWASDLVRGSDGAIVYQSNGEPVQS